MTTGFAGGAVTLIIAGLAVLLMIKLVSAPFRLIIKLLLNTLSGFVLLIIINALGSVIGLSVGINWLNALIVGLLGLPGLGAILILHWLL